MTVPARLAAFAAALLAVFGLSFGVGRATGDGGGASRDDLPEVPHQGPTHPGPAHEGTG